MLKRLIEVALPLKEVSEQSAREKSIRHGHISTLHIWWARRPLAACRAAVFASLIPDPDDPECPEQFRTTVREFLGRSKFKPTNGKGSPVEDTPRNRCLEFIKHLVRWENSNNPEYVEPARKLIAAAHPILHPEAETDKPRVLDPFGGGGTIPLEALRLGCDAYAVDLNPVAHLIELCTLVHPQIYGQPDSRPVPDYIKRAIEHNRAKRKGRGEADLFEEEEMRTAADVAEIIPNLEITEEEYRENPLLADIRYWGTWVGETVAATIARFYSDECDAVPVAFLWTRTCNCPNPTCGCELPLLQTTAVHADGDKVSKLVPEFDGKQLTFGIEQLTSPSRDQISGTMGRNSASCPSCNTVIHKSDLERIGKAEGFGQRMTCVIESRGNGKSCRLASEKDLERYSDAEAQLELLRQNVERSGMPLPDGELPYLRSIFNVHVYGLNKWSKLFNARQSLALLSLAGTIRSAARHISAVHDAEYATALESYLTLALGRQADYSSSLCLWSHTGGFLAHTFGRQALPMVWDYAEGNPFSGMTGNWFGGVDWICRVVEFLSSSPMSSARVVRGNATRTPFQDSFFESVVTDPPYYDAIPYANLSDFFYVWFRSVLSETMPNEFSTPLAPKGPEIVQLAERNQAYKNKTKQFFEDGMRKAFAEGRRTLVDNGLYTVVFAHKTTSAWETLVAALTEEGLWVTASWPLHTERPGRLRAHQSAALASSVFLVCRKREQTVGDGLWDDVRQELKAVAKERLDFFWDQGIRGADFFISAIGPALSVFGRYTKVIRISGAPVKVGEFLDEVRALVTNYALTKILHTTNTANIDSESRFYVVWKWSYGDAKVPADESFKLAQALGIDTEDMWDKTGVLNKSGENVQCVAVEKRTKIKGLGEPDEDGTPASIIDVLHRMCVFRDKGDNAGMAQFLGHSGQARNPALWLVAQAVSEILPDGEREKQLMQGLLNQQEGLEEATRQRELF